MLVIEHDPDVIDEPDRVIDLGPEGGNAGGRIAATATPEDVVRQGTPRGCRFGSGAATLKIARKMGIAEKTGKKSLIRGFFSC